MTDMSNDIEEAICQLKEGLPEGPYLINDILNTTAKYTPLLIEGNSQNIRIENKERKFSFKEPVFIRRIELTGNARESTKDIEITIHLEGGDSVKPRITKASEEQAHCIVNKFATEFHLKSNHAIVKPKLTKLTVIGYPISSLSEISHLAKETIDTKYHIENITKEYRAQLDTIKSDLASKELRLSNVAAEIADLESQKNLKLNELENLTEKESELALQVSNLDSDISVKSSALTTITNNHDQLAQISKELNQKISSKKSELESIVNDRNLISDEYKDYVKEGRGQSRVYAALATVSLATITFCVYELYKGAEKILLTTHESSLEILSSLLLRIPFAIVFSLGIFYSWKLTRSLFERVFRIHEDRLTLAKLLVIAKDTVSSAANDLNISNQAKFQERVRLKIEILKSHLAKDLDRNFTYNPKAIGNQRISADDNHSDVPAE